MKFGNYNYYYINYKVIETSHYSWPRHVQAGVPQLGLDVDGAVLLHRVVHALLLHHELPPLALQRRITLPQGRLRQEGVQPEVTS